MEFVPRIETVGFVDTFPLARMATGHQGLHIPLKPEYLTSTLLSMQDMRKISADVRLLRPLCMPYGPDGKPHASQSQSAGSNCKQRTTAVDFLFENLRKKNELNACTNLGNLAKETPTSSAKPHLSLNPKAIHLADSQGLLCGQVSGQSSKPQPPATVKHIARCPLSVRGVLEYGDSVLGLIWVFRRSFRQDCRYRILGLFPGFVAFQPQDHDARLHGPMSS